MKKKKKQQSKKKIIYKARNGAPFKVDDAQDIGEFIEKIPEKTPENILKSIKKNPRHTIYDCIEWDDKKASYQYRLQQVRNIVNHITIEIEEIGSSVPVRAFYSVNSIKDKGPVYVDIEMAFKKEYYRDQIRQRAYVELNNWRERYVIYKELKPIVKAISPFLKNKEV